MVVTLIYLFILTFKSHLSIGSDIGRSSYGILRVKETFEYAFNVVDSALRNKYYFKVNPKRYVLTFENSIPENVYPEALTIILCDIFLHQWRSTIRSSSTYKRMDGLLSMWMVYIYRIILHHLHFSGWCIFHHLHFSGWCI